MSADQTPRPTLEETVALLEATLESTHDGILVVSFDRRIVRYNQRFLEMFRVDPAIASDHDAMLDAITAQLEDQDALKLRNEVLRTRPETSALDILRFKDGRVFERFVAPQKVRGEILGRVVSYHDITRSVTTEQALEQHRAFLEKAQEVAHIGSWVAELDGSDRLGWSTEAHRIFGVPLGEFAGNSSAFFEMVHPDDREAVRAAASAAAVDGGATYDIQHRIVRTDGKVRWVHEQANVVRDRGGTARMVGTVQDITERRVLEEQLRQAQKMEAVGRLAGGVAHDLNNALTAIAGYTELALGELPQDHTSRPDVMEIRRAAERAASVTRQLLAFSRKQLLEPRIFDLNITVKSLSRLLNRALGKNIDLRAQTDPTLPRIKGDPGQIEQAIVNLALNARDAMPEGGRLDLVTTFAEVDEEFARSHHPMPPGKYVTLSVADSGHGISPEAQAHIFEPFFTTKEVGKGTGLGLAMVYGTVKQTGGFIYVDSKPGAGTTFRLYFPSAEAPAPTATREADRKTVTAAATPTILVVEDEPAVRSLVAATLTHAGYRVIQAESGEEAVRVAGNQPDVIDLLLTDANMPGMSGIELASALLGKRPSLPVVIMSGYTDDALGMSGLPDAVLLLQKPFTPRELRLRIGEVLKK